MRTSLPAYQERGEMIHHHRTFAVGVVDNLDELVEKLTDRTWTLCTEAYPIVKTKKSDN